MTAMRAMPVLALLSGEKPLLAERLSVAHHGQRAVQPLAVHYAAPEQLAVLGALGLRFERDRVTGRLRRVGAVAVLVAIAGGRAEAPVLEDDGVGIPLGLAALQHHPNEVAAIEHVHVRSPQ